MPRLPLIALACCLALAACGKDDDDDGVGGPATATVEERGVGGTGTARDAGPDADERDADADERDADADERDADADERDADAGPPPGFARYRGRSQALRRTGAQFALEVQICLSQGTKPARLARCFREAGGEFRQEYGRHDELVSELAAGAGPGRCRDRLKTLRRRASAWRDAFREAQDAGVAFGRAAAGDGDGTAASPRLAEAIDAIVATGSAVRASGHRAARDCR